MPKNNSLGLCNLHHRRIGVQHWWFYTILYTMYIYIYILHHTIPYDNIAYSTALESRISGSILWILPGLSVGDRCEDSAQRLVQGEAP